MVTVQIATRRAGVPHARSFTRWANAAAAGGPQLPELTIRVVGAAESRRLNRTYRGKDKPTNVLSFPASGHKVGQGDKLLGDIVIAYETLERESRDESRDFLHHLAHLAVHGFLHLIGFDHETDAQAEEMEGLESRIMMRLNMPDPYVARESDNA